VETKKLLAKVAKVAKLDFETLACIIQIIDCQLLLCI